LREGEVNLVRVGAVTPNGGLCEIKKFGFCLASYSHRVLKDVSDPIMGSSNFSGFRTHPEKGLRAHLTLANREITSSHMKISKRVFHWAFLGIIM
jgi:hypothetical protein